jgi:CubicO group peptidase (beta-lactamase class C family)
VQLADGWRVATPEALGVDGAQLALMTAAIERGAYTNVHAVLIERDGRLIFERYFTGDDERRGDQLGRVTFDHQTLHDVRSVGKSVVSALFGIALAGDEAALDRGVYEFFPEHAGLRSGARDSIRVRHVLSMTTGWQWDESTSYWNEGNDERLMNRSNDHLQYVLSRPLADQPGTKWTYNGGATELLAEMIRRKTGQSLTAYARSALFTPLGITEFEWLGNLAGHPAAASGLRMRPRDLARFGSLYLHQGRWQGRQVIPAAWVEQSTRRRIDSPASSGGAWDVGYGYQWWHGRLKAGGGMLEVFGAMGKGQQRVFVVPELKLVVTILAGTYETAAD